MESVDGDAKFTCAGPMMNGTTIRMGKTAVLDVQGIKVIVASRPAQVSEPPIDINIFMRACIPAD